MSLFTELGLRRYLNAEDTFTTNGASCMPPEVYRAMEEISGAWVDLEQMQRRVGEALAQCTRNEWSLRIRRGGQCPDPVRRRGHQPGGPGGLPGPAGRLPLPAQ